MIKNNVIDRYYYVLLLPDRSRLTNATDSMMIKLHGRKHPERKLGTKEEIT